MLLSRGMFMSRPGEPPDQSQGDTMSVKNVRIEIPGHGCYVSSSEAFELALKNSRADLLQIVKEIVPEMVGRSKLRKFELAAMLAEWKTADLDESPADVLHPCCDSAPDGCYCSCHYGLNPADTPSGTCGFSDAQ